MLAAGYDPAGGANLTPRHSFSESRRNSAQDGIPGGSRRNSVERRSIALDAGLVLVPGGSSSRRNSADRRPPLFPDPGSVVPELDTTTMTTEATMTAQQPPPVAPMRWDRVPVDEVTGSKAWLVDESQPVSKRSLWLAYVFPCVPQGRIQKMVENHEAGITDPDVVGEWGCCGPMCCVLCLCCPCFARPAAAAERGHVRRCHDIRGSKAEDRTRSYGRSLAHSEREMRARGKQLTRERAGELPPPEIRFAHARNSTSLFSGPEHGSMPDIPEVPEPSSQTGGNSGDVSPKTTMDGSASVSSPDGGSSAAAAEGSGTTEGAWEPTAAPKPILMHPPPARVPSNRRVSFGSPVTIADVADGQPESSSRRGSNPQPSHSHSLSPSSGEGTDTDDEVDRVLAPPARARLGESRPQGANLAAGGMQEVNAPTWGWQRDDTAPRSDDPSIVPDAELDLPGPLDEGPPARDTGKYPEKGPAEDDGHAGARRG